MGSLKKVIYTALVAFQAGIVVTGGAVRLTGSGLGCPTWPQCTPGSYTPVPHQAQGRLHSWIEFGNRLLTFVLIISIIAAVIGVIRWRREYREQRVRPAGHPRETGHESAVPVLLGRVIGIVNAHDDVVGGEADPCASVNQCHILLYVNSLRCRSHRTLTS